MHFSSFTETDGGSVSLEIDFNASDMYEVFRSATGADGSVAEGRQIGSGNKLYQTHVGFQGWFFTEGPEALALEVEEALEGVYDILNSVSDESPVRQEDLDGVPAFRLQAPAPAELLGFLAIDADSPQPGFDLWIGKEALLPLRIEMSSEDPRVFVRFIFSDYGKKKDITEPEQALDYMVLGKLFQGGPFTAEEVGQLVNTLPLAVQGCLESEMGDEDYHRMTKGDGDPDLFLNVTFRFPCANIMNRAMLGLLRHGNPSEEALAIGLSEILKPLARYKTQCLFALWGTQKFEEISTGSRPPQKLEIADMLDCSAPFLGHTHLRDYLDLNDFSISKEDLDGDVLACLHEALGLRVLVEIGTGEWDPRPDQLDAVAHCVP